MRADRADRRVTKHYHAARALSAASCATMSRISVDAAGTIADVAVHSNARAGERIGGLVVPGMANLHSHAFQRAMAGLAERAGPAGDDFWRWREVMYRFLAVLTPDDVEAIAAQLYVECLRHGYTVGRRVPLPAQRARRLAATTTRASCRSGSSRRRDAAGIGLTLLPVLYRRAQFGGAAPTEGQRRFVLDAR